MRFGGQRMNRVPRYGLWMLSTVVFALTLNAQTSDETKLVGKWKLNIAKSQYQTAPGPIEAMMVISDATASHFKWKVTSAQVENGRKAWREPALVFSLISHRLQINPHLLGLLVEMGPLQT